MNFPAWSQMVELLEKKLTETEKETHLDQLKEFPESVPALEQSTPDIDGESKEFQRRLTNDS